MNVTPRWQTLGVPAASLAVHEVAFVVSLMSGAALVLAASGTGPKVAVAVYATSMTALFGVSALLHRCTLLIARNVAPLA